MLYIAGFAWRCRWFEGTSELHTTTPSSRRKDSSLRTNTCSRREFGGCKIYLIIPLNIPISIFFLGDNDGETISIDDETKKVELRDKNYCSFGSCTQSRWGRFRRGKGGRRAKLAGSTPSNPNSTLTLTSEVPSWKHALSNLQTPGRHLQPNKQNRYHSRQCSRATTVNHSQTGPTEERKREWELLRGDSHDSNTPPLYWRYLHVHATIAFPTCTGSWCWRASRSGHFSSRGIYLSVSSVAPYSFGVVCIGIELAGEKYPSWGIDPERRRVTPWGTSAWTLNSTRARSLEDECML